MRLAFLGTPAFAVPAIATLLDGGHDIAAVYTQPARPRGRGQAVRPGAVEAFARAAGLELRAPASLRGAAEIEAFEALGVEAAVVVAYGQILVARVLDAPRLGAFNLHASLLPRWRGAAPIQRAIMAGDPETGVQLMRMSVELDEGPVLATACTPIEPDDTAATLADRLAELGAALLVPTLEGLTRGGVIETPQVGEPVYARKITAAETRIDWSASAEEVDRRIRGLSPTPGAWFEAPGPRGPVRVKALLSQVATPAAVLAPGEVHRGDEVVVGCGDGAVRLLRLQREGRGVQEGEEFRRGTPLAPGVRLV